MTATATEPQTPIRFSRAAQGRFHPLIDRLDDRLEAHLERLLESDLFRILAAPETSPQLAAALLKNIMLEITSYGRDIIEAGFTAIGRMPHTSPALMKAAVGHLMDEVTHPDMARGDFARLGGDEQWARGRSMTPGSLAMVATVRYLCERTSPFTYMGLMYLFEALTPVLAARAAELFRAKAVADEAQVFLDEHVEGDVKHTEWLRGLISKIVREHPESEPWIEYGLECFAAVYPLPIWDAVIARARAEASG